MISKNNTKLIKSLSDVKNRRETGLFVAEGEKIVNELLASGLVIEQIFAVKDWIQNHPSHARLCLEVRESQLESLSLQKTPNKVLALARLPDYSMDLYLMKDQLCLVADNIQDPGNMGTIIRLCNWFGIGQIICSNESADAFNPRVVQASMGAVFNTQIHSTSLPGFLTEYQSKFRHRVYGTFLKGESIYSTKTEPAGLIVLGNESKGISAEVAKFIDKAITIPSFPADKRSMESLNVSVAAAIILSEFRRGEIT